MRKVSSARRTAHVRVGAFTLLEVLSVVVIGAVVLGLGLSVLSSFQKKATVVDCTNTLRGLGHALLLYTADHEGEFPRSWHSAGAYREPGWALSIAPYLGVEEEQLLSDWEGAFNRLYRSAAHKETSPYIYSYALNVYFELDPAGDSYPGSPATWRRVMTLPAPGKTVLLAQTRPVMFGDHVMAHLWTSANAARNALNHEIHNGQANYLFADGHVKLLPVEQVFDPANGVNLFRPDAAN